MANTSLLNIIERVIGKGKQLRNNESSFYCTFCRHHKRKLQVNLITQLWQCWVCGAKGRKIYSLLKKAGASKTQIKELNDCLGDYIPQTHTSTKEYDVLSLPDDYQPLYNANHNNPEVRNATHYLKKRNITADDILKYDIGFCSSGQYKGKIIIPSYNENGELNFFTGRAYYNTDFKHKNPMVSKDIIGFDLLINWNYPIVLVEGAFDAIAVKRNAIPLFGKIVLGKLRKKIIEKKVKHLYIALDKDALIKALDICDYFINHGINVHLVEMHEKDPSDLGFNVFNKMLSETRPLTGSALMEKKIMGKLF